MFDFRLSRFGMLRWLQANADAGDSAGLGSSSDDSAEDDPEKDEAGKKKEKKPAEVSFTADQQKMVDQIVGDARVKEREKAKLELEKETEKAQKKAQQEALEKNKEWETLATTRAEEITTLTKERDDLLAYKESSDKYKTALEAMVTETKKTLPKHIIPLIDKMDPVEALEYMTKHAKDLNIKAGGVYPETPEEKERTITKDEEASGMRANREAISSSF